MYHGNPTERAEIRSTQFGPIYDQIRESQAYLANLAKASAKRSKNRGNEEKVEEEAAAGDLSIEVQTQAA